MIRQRRNAAATDSPLRRMQAAPATSTNEGCGVNTTRYPASRAVSENSAIAATGCRRSQIGVADHASGSYITVCTSAGTWPCATATSNRLALAQASAGVAEPQPPLKT